MDEMCPYYDEELRYCTLVEMWCTVEDPAECVLTDNGEEE